MAFQAVYELSGRKPPLYSLPRDTELVGRFLFVSNNGNSGTVVPGEATLLWQTPNQRVEPGDGSFKSGQRWEATRSVKPFAGMWHSYHGRPKADGLRLRATGHRGNKAGEVRRSTLLTVKS